MLGQLRLLEAEADENALAAEEGGHGEVAEMAEELVLMIDDQRLALEEEIKRGGHNCR